MRIAILSACLLAIVAATTAATPAIEAPDAPTGPTLPKVCTEVPDPTRWDAPASPDAGAEEAIIAVHRGAANLAPENTMDAYRYAIAYGVEMIEVDVQQTLDHQYVAFHDIELDDKSDGSGYVMTHTREELLELNVADNDRWRGSAYDPSRMPTLENVLQLAADTGTGIMFDLKESVVDAASVALLAQEYGVVEGSVFIPYVPGRAEAIKATVPDAVLNFSNQFGELPDNAPPGALYALTPEYGSFGSSLPAFDAGDIAEVHDGCGIVLPNVYQGDVTGTEAGDLAHARAIGADGAQVNNPDVAIAVLGRSIGTRIERTDGQACLVDVEHGFGLPGKTLEFGDGSTDVTARGGCVSVTPGQAPRWAGDGSTLPAS